MIEPRTLDGKIVQVDLEHLKVHVDVLPFLEEALRRVPTKNRPFIRGPGPGYWNLSVRGDGFFRSNLLCEPAWENYSDQIRYYENRSALQARYPDHEKG